ncbi:hypothetical protein [Sorangium sp. So ce1024]|uniref:hypothetical protein n=1 Tax=Sorangium sp. So ce1024 TaxID=3133327 RepID=UPI003F1150FC
MALVHAGATGQLDLPVHVPRGGALGEEHVDELDEAGVRAQRSTRSICSGARARGR